jgi:hypothetical protein
VYTAKGKMINGQSVINFKNRLIVILPS